MSRTNKTILDVLPTIPTKKFFRVGDVANLCYVETHTIRYWAAEFSKFIKPIIKSKYVKYYRYEDVQTLRRIKKLLYVEKFTIKGAIRQLSKFWTNFKFTVNLQWNFKLGVFANGNLINLKLYKKTPTLKLWVSG